MYVYIYLSEAAFEASELRRVGTGGTRASPFRQVFRRRVAHEAFEEERRGGGGGAAAHQSQQREQQIAEIAEDRAAQGRRRVGEAEGADLGARDEAQIG